MRFSSVDKHTLPDERLVRLCNYVDVYKNEHITAGMDFMVASATASECRRFAIEVGDVLLTKDSEEPHDIGVPACVVDQLQGVLCGYHLALARPRKGTMEGRFLQRVLSATGIRDQFFSKAVGVTRFGLSLDDIGNSLVPVPPLDVQHRIASFLDRKTTAIDELIKKKERLIELLQEKRQGVITQAVTKGLNPNVPMNRDGLLWTGPFPQHWATARLSHFAVVSNGSTPDRSRSDYWENGTIPWLSSGKVNDYVVTEADQFITPLALKECSVSLVPPGAVLVGMIGEGRTRGMSAFLNLSACINQNMAAVVPGRRLDGHFLHAVLIAAYEELRVLGRGGQQDALNCQILGSFRFPLPPLEEQLRISAQLSATTMAVDRVVARIGQHVTLLKELRQALISTAVTGQLDLSKEAA